MNTHQLGSSAPAPPPSGALRIGFLEPHLRRYGGIRRVVELANALVDRGHDVAFYLPDDAELACTWLPCRASVRRTREGTADPLDALIFNHEPQWHLLWLFDNVQATVFYALHYSRLYAKAGSWESLRADVSLRLANSSWTADRIAEEVGERPTVLLGGVNRDHFHPVPGARKAYPILAVGDPREWKGHDTVVETGRLLGLPVETYAGKNLPQAAMAGEYAAAEVFVVGSRVEGFGQPGLEALACGVPLVTTDNGGCREYAIHEETALVVPPDDPEAMAAAVARVRQDPGLAKRLVRNGLELVDRTFDWERSAEDLDSLLRSTVAGTEVREPARRALRWSPPENPELSVVVLPWDQLHYTQDCVESIRQHTDVPYELIIVDNGSNWEAANYARHAADTAVLNPRNLGFAEGMNQGLAAARGTYIAFVNNDTVLPPRWASRLTSHLTKPDVGIVVPAVTNARDPRIVRSEPGTAVETLLSFEAPPPAVLYVMNRQVMNALGGWGREFPIASGEDMDLCFKVWVNDLRIVYDSRVLVEHVSKGTAGVKLDDWRALWAQNRAAFLAKWQSANLNPPRLPQVDPASLERNIAVARAVAGWMERYFDVLTRHRAEPSAGEDGPTARAAPAGRSLVRSAWRALKPLLPLGVRAVLFRRFRAVYYRYFPERRG